MPLQHAKLEDNKSEMVPEGQNLFMVAAITALYSSSFSQGFSNSQCQAAIQALLRHGAYEDGAHYHAKTPGGLLLKSHVHPAQYVDGVCTSMWYLQTTCSVDLVIVLFRVDNTCHRSCDLVTRHTLCCI